jgi:peptide deformylase
MIYPIVAYGDPVLKQLATDIEKGGDIDIKKLSEDMFETMYNANGVGLAGPQVGLNKRIFVIDAASMEDEEEDGEEKDKEALKKVVVNAEILEETGEEWEFEEGCLSIPDVRGLVSRKPNIKVRYYDENWQLHEEDFDGMAARVIQHEYDHIEGILFTEHLSALKKRLIKGKLGNISKGKVHADYRMRFATAAKKRGMR